MYMSIFASDFYVCKYIYINTHEKAIHMYICERLYVYVQLHLQAHIFAADCYVYLRVTAIYICIFASELYIYIYTHIHVYIHMYTYIYICIYICIVVYINTFIYM